MGRREYFYSFELKSAFASDQLLRRLWQNNNLHPTAKVSKGVWRSEEVNRKCRPSSNKTVQLSTLYTDPGRHNRPTQRCRQTDRRQYNDNSRSVAVRSAKK